MIKKCISCCLALALSVGLTVPTLAAGPAFSDVPTSHWAYFFVSRAAQNGWVTGVGGDQFAPNSTLTFSQFYTMITPVFAADKFSDYTAPSGSSWWQKFMWVGAKQFPAHSIWLDLHQIYDEHGVNIYTDEDVQATIERYAEQPISRSDAVSIMWRVLEVPGLDEQVSGVEAALEKILATNGELNLYDQTSASVCYAAGLISGNEKGELNLDSSLTRAEGCVMLCNLVDYVDEHGGDVATNPGGTEEPGEPENPVEPGSGLGQKLSSGATAAAGVKEQIGKNDAYPTYGNSDVVSPNGYFTGATDVEIGNAKLMYEFLDMVNEVRVAEGYEPLTWVQSDAAEEHTLQRCNELISNYSHDRPNGKFSNEVLAEGYSTIQKAFNGWINSPGHKRTLMFEEAKYLSAARAGTSRDSRWIICVWTDANVNLVERFSSANYDYSDFIDGV